MPSWIRIRIPNPDPIRIRNPGNTAWRWFLKSVSSLFFPFFSFDTLKRAFVGVHKVIQANDKSECAQDAVEEILRSTDRN